MVHVVVGVIMVLVATCVRCAHAHPKPLTKDVPKTVEGFEREVDYKLNEQKKDENEKRPRHDATLVSDEGESDLERAVNLIAAVIGKKVELQFESVTKSLSSEIKSVKSQVNGLSSKVKDLTYSHQILEQNVGQLKIAADDAINGLTDKTTYIGQGIPQTIQTNESKRSVSYSGCVSWCVGIRRERGKTWNALVYDYASNSCLCYNLARGIHEQPDNAHHRYRLYRFV